MEQADKYGLYEDEKENTGLENMVAYHSTILALNSKKPCAGLFTYNLEEDTAWAQYILAKVLPYINIDGELFGPSDASEYKTFDIPGGVIGQYNIKDVNVKIEIYPLLYGREEEKDRGGAVYCISTTPATSVNLNIGGGKKNDMVGWKQVLSDDGKYCDIMSIMTRATMVTEKFRDKEPCVNIENGIAMITSLHPYIVAVKSEGQITKNISVEGGQYICNTFENGSGLVMLAFDRQKECVLDIISKDTREQLEKSKKYYINLVESKISTPNKSLDFAFKSAIYNLDYNFLAPYGWVEAVQHWMSIWHQQHTMAADWLGQEERTKTVITTQAKNLYPDGAVPMFIPNGKPFRAFGGSDQFFPWEIRHHLRHTNDIELAKQILPFLETVVTHCFKENDPDGNFSLHWGEQIGNQEDYISHFHVSSSPSIEAVNMLESLMEVADIAGEPEKSRHYNALAVKSRQSLKQLWSSDLGRYVYEIDTTGKSNLDGQYHTYAYPSIFKIVDNFDSYTSLRHLRDRLIGNSGEVHCSNNFPNHMSAGGTQAGATQQPWGTMGLAAVGLNNEAIRPLEYIAKIVDNSGCCSGSWPEVSEEGCSYFSPPAGVFIQAMIESIYGLTLNMAKETITICPCFPHDWDEALLELPHYKASYTKKDNIYNYTIRTSQILLTSLNWRFPFGEVKQFLVNGKPEKYTVVPCINGIMIECAIPKSICNEITVEFIEIPLNVIYPKVLAEGQMFNVKAEGFNITSIIDRSGLSKEIIFDDGLTIILKDDLLKPYLKYGKLGLLNFSRRTIFIRLTGENGQETIYPLDFTLLPALQIEAKINESVVNLTIRNNIKAKLNNATLFSGGESLSLDANKSSCINLSQKFMQAILPGKNEAMFLLEDGPCAFFTLKSNKTVITKKVELPQDSLVDDTEWVSLKRMQILNHTPWLNQKNPMLDMEGTTISHTELPVEFNFSPGKFAPVSWLKKPCLDIPIVGEYRKFYILLFSIMDCQDMFSPVLRITAKRDDLKLASKEFYYPGDLDGFWGLGAVGCYATANSFEQRNDKLLPYPDKENGDWSIAKPIPDNIYYYAEKYGNSFPASNMWCDSYTIKLSNSYLNIIEFDLQKFNNLTNLIIEPIGTQPAFGIVAIEAI